MIAINEIIQRKERTGRTDEQEMSVVTEKYRRGSG